MASAALDSLLPASAEQRRIMVDRQVRTFDVTDQIVTTRMLEVPRELFLPPELRALAYSDSAIELAGSGGPRARTLLPPFLVGRMLQALAPTPSDRALDIAGGTGYTAALLSGLTAHVTAVESDDALAARASANFLTLRLPNARSIAAPLATGGVGPRAYDVIFVNGCMIDHLSVLAGLLAPAGRMIAIVRKPSGATSAALIGGRGENLSVRPLFEAQAPTIADFRAEPAFVL